MPYVSDKKLILTNEGEVVEAAPGLSGTLVVAEGGSLSDEDAKKYGLMLNSSGAFSKPPLPESPIMTKPIDSKAMRRSGGLNPSARAAKDDAKSSDKSEGKPWAEKSDGGLPLDEPSISNPPKQIKLGK